MQFREALQPLSPDEQDDDDQPRGFRRLETLLVEQLSWDAEALQRDPATLQTWTRELPELMVGNNEGRTSTYNRFHDPAEFSDGILELRRLHDEMDQAVLATYGLSDALPQALDNTPGPCGFGLDYLDTDDDALLPPDLHERIASGDLFFPTAPEACNFQTQLRRYGAVKPSKNLPWRHRWPDVIRADVLARLLALNAERYAEEQAMGLHSKGGKKTAQAAGTTGGKRRGRPPKVSPPGDVEQIGLSF